MTAVTEEGLGTILLSVFTVWAWRTLISADISSAAEVLAV